MADERLWRLKDSDLTPAALDGLLAPVYKPPGITSFTAVNRIRRASGVKRVGHGGTLDKFAEGLLVVGIGRTATRQLGGFLGQEKEYIAEVALGVVTDTYDPYGRVVETNEFTPFDRSAITEILRRFVGEIEQLPPAYSAVKVEGERLYRAALRGVEVSRKPRTVTIREIELLDTAAGGFTMRVVCSKGTYIRALAYDVGRGLGVGAHLKRLVRTRIGDVRVKDARQLEDFLAYIKAIRTSA